MRLGVLGGTFDPPHFGHLILAEQARDQLDLEHVLWVPAGEQPLKRGQSVASIDCRLDMLKLTLEHNPAFELSRVDVDRPGPHYSVDMLEIIANQYPGGELYFLMGSDSLSDLPRWRNPQHLIEQAILAVMHRPGVQINLDHLKDIIPGLTDRLVYVDSPLIEIAADDIRARVAKGRSIRYLLPDPVQDYILQQGLYDS